MNTVPVEPAALAFDADGVPFCTRYQRRYHAAEGAWPQAQRVFLAGNGLPARWQGRGDFVVLETGFGPGSNFLATWKAWRDDPQRCTRLVYIAIEQHPPTRAQLARVHAASPVPELAHALQQAWPPLTPNLHTVRLDQGRVQLMLAWGDVHAWLPELVATVDAYSLDGFSSDVNPRMWDERVCKALGRLAAPGATLATWSTDDSLRQRLRSAGFEVTPPQGGDGGNGTTVARHAPRYTPRRAPASRAARPGTEAHALVVGGGLAGCAAAWALAEHGWRSTVLERQPQIASEASGNPGGLFHGIVNAQDGVHARFNRAAALAAQHAVQVAITQHGVPGQSAGLLRLNTETEAAHMQAMLQRLGAPAEFVQALTADEASALSGIVLRCPAWFYPGGGWVQPAGLARSFLERAGHQVAVRTGVDVQAVQPTAGGWRLLDGAGRTVGEAATVVLANAGAAMPLLGEPGWPVERLRGQISLVPDDALTLPRLPVAGAGYLLPAIDGQALFGATTQRHDADPSVRLGDHLHNLQQLARLTGQALDAATVPWTGRTAWRFSSIDRLPIVGAVPLASAADASPALRLDHPRFVPRQPGLFVLTALGSRGITWSALAAQVLASGITGAPVPLEADLLAAIDPARFVSRARRRAAVSVADAPGRAEWS